MYFITIDIETTGLDIYEDVPIQMALSVHDEKDRLVWEHSSYILTAQKLRPIITKITGLTDEILLSKGLSIADSIQQWKSVMHNFQPVTLLGYNIINFDFPMIQNWINTNSAGKFKFPPICAIVDVMIQIAAERKSKWLKLAKAAEVYDIDFVAADLHDAMADVRVTWELYKKIRKET